MGSKKWMVAALAAVMVLGAATAAYAAGPVDRGVANEARGAAFMDTDGGGAYDNAGQGRMGLGMGSGENFVDADGDGVCDNAGQGMGRGRGGVDGTGCGCR